jgi:phosphogluconate dehydratase
MAHGHQVALVTDGRMSGASGKVPAAIHLTPEAEAGGPIARLREGDVINLDAVAGTLTVEVSPEEFGRREPATCELEPYHYGYGRELFHTFRTVASGPEFGASSIS